MTERKMNKGTTSLAVRRDDHTGTVAVYNRRERFEVWVHRDGHVGIVTDKRLVSVALDGEIKNESLPEFHQPGGCYEYWLKNRLILKEFRSGSGT